MTAQNETLTEEIRRLRLTPSKYQTTSVSKMSFIDHASATDISSLRELSVDKTTDQTVVLSRIEAVMDEVTRMMNELS
jgi:hypothetical protein